MNDDHRESGRIPRTVDCELTHDLGKSGLKMIHWWPVIVLQYFLPAMEFKLIEGIWTNIFL